ncbi:MAG: hypothetical protein JWO44_2604 [Bacteroidetes bacterium]|nr:hypothetical protein [Bacteroidota bacterium]
MFKQFAAAVKAYGKAFSLVSNNNLWVYFLYPVAIFILLLAGGTALIDSLSGFLKSQLIAWINLPKPGSTGASILAGALSFVLGIGLKIIFFFVYSILLKNLVLIVLSPVLALISERADEIITGNTYPFSFPQLIKDALRGSLIAICNTFIQLGLVLCCFALMLIPVIGWFAPVFLVIINYYFYGFSMMDYTSERYKLNAAASMRFARKNKGLAIGNGFIFALLFAIPFAGVIIAPILSVIAATVVSIEAHQNNTPVSYAKN